MFYGARTFTKVNVVQLVQQFHFGIKSNCASLSAGSQAIMWSYQAMQQCASAGTPREGAPAGWMRRSTIDVGAAAVQSCASCVQRICLAGGETKDFRVLQHRQNAVLKSFEIHLKRLSDRVDIGWMIFCLSPTFWICAAWPVRPCSRGSSWDFQSQQLVTVKLHRPRKRHSESG